MLVVLTGFMGVGKTTIGNRLARALGVSLMDTDEMVESRCGMSVRKIVEDRGETIFRRFETEAIGMLPARARTAVSLGGGALGRSRNLRSLRRRGGVIVYLEAPLGFFGRGLGGPKRKPVRSGRRRGREGWRFCLRSEAARMKEARTW